MSTDKNIPGTGRPVRKFRLSRRMFIICLDSFLLLTFLLLLSPRMTGLPLHEIIGFILFIPLMIHLLLSWVWIRQSTKNIFKPTSRRNRFNYFLNAILFTLVIIEIVSGIAISQVALPFMGVRTINDMSWRFLHNKTLNFTVLFIGLHIAVNWEWILASLRRRFSVQYNNNKKQIRFAGRILKLLLRTCIILFAAGIVTIAIYLLMGSPNTSREYIQDEVARFRPGIGHGIGQFAGEAFLISLVAYVARRWMRVKL